jgi:hypothetical protein
MVHLDSPDHGNVVLELSPSTVATLAIHYTTAQKLEDILVAHEFPMYSPMICLVLHTTRGLRSLGSWHREEADRGLTS